MQQMELSLLFSFPCNSFGNLFHNAVIQSNVMQHKCSNEKSKFSHVWPGIILRRQFDNSLDKVLPEY